MPSARMFQLQTDQATSTHLIRRLSLDCPNHANLIEKLTGILIAGLPSKLRDCTFAHHPTRRVAANIEAPNSSSRVRLAPRVRRSRYGLRLRRQTTSANNVEQGHREWAHVGQRCRAVGITPLSRPDDERLGQFFRNDQTRGSRKSQPRHRALRRSTHAGALETTGSSLSRRTAGRSGRPRFGRTNPRSRHEAGVTFRHSGL